MMNEEEQYPNLIIATFKEVLVQRQRCLLLCLDNADSWEMCGLLNVAILYCMLVPYAPFAEPIINSVLPTPPYCVITALPRFSNMILKLFNSLARPTKNAEVDSLHDALRL